VHSLLNNDVLRMHMYMSSGCQSDVMVGLRLPDNSNGQSHDSG